MTPSSDDSASSLQCTVPVSLRFSIRHQTHAQSVRLCLRYKRTNHNLYLLRTTHSDLQGAPEWTGIHPFSFSVCSSASLGSPPSSSAPGSFAAPGTKPTFFFTSTHTDSHKAAALLAGPDLHQRVHLRRPVRQPQLLPQTIESFPHLTTPQSLLHVVIVTLQIQVAHHDSQNVLTDLLRLCWRTY